MPKTQNRVPFSWLTNRHAPTFLLVLRYLAIEDGSDTGKTTRDGRNLWEVENRGHFRTLGPALSRHKTSFRAKNCAVTLFCAV